MIDDTALGQRWLISGLAIVIALSLYSLLQPFAGPASQLPFLLAIALVAVVSGRWPATLVLAVGLGVALWRVAQGSSPLPDAWSMRAAILLGYWALGTLIILIADSARRHAQESQRAQVEFDRVMRGGQRRHLALRLRQTLVDVLGQHRTDARPARGVRARQSRRMAAGDPSRRPGGVAGGAA